MRIPVLGVMIDALTMAEAVERVSAFITERGPHLVATANAEMVMMAKQDEGLAKILAAADLVVPDGAGVVWAARHQGYEMPERVAGYDLAQHLLALSATQGYKVYFFGGAPGVADTAKEKAEAWYPGINIVGTRNGFFTAEDEAAIITAIRESSADILLVALGVPKQEKWLAAHLHKLGVPVSIGVGGSFDVMAGLVERAPLWMQRAGLEWFFRLSKQPSRLMRMLSLPRFALQVMVAKKR